MAHHIGFTGTQVGMSANQRVEFIRYLKKLRKNQAGTLFFHHGDCIGADEQADSIARELGYRIVIHPPRIDTKRAHCDQREPHSIIHPAMEYMDRNASIVRECYELLATPKENEEVLRSGTWSTIRRAKRKGIPVTIFPR